MQLYQYNEKFSLENGKELAGLTVAFHTYGSLNAAKSNVIWVCHALTANSDATRWWPGVIGENTAIDPSRYFIVCANIVGSCYGSSGPLSIDPSTGKPYYATFPEITIRDMVNAHILLRKHLNIDRIHLLMGGSMGGYQVLEWAIMEKEVIENLFLIGTSAAETPWGIAIHTAQRLSLEADPTWNEARELAGYNGLKAARAIGMLTYRNYGIMVSKQADADLEKLDNYKAASYIIHQGEKLAERFNAISYWILTKAMDTHQLARGRKKSIEAILQSIVQPTLIMGITSDILCPLEEQRKLASNMPHAQLVEIDSSYGHDGFMVESEKITPVIRDWLNKV